MRQLQIRNVVVQLSHAGSLTREVVGWEAVVNIRELVLFTPFCVEHVPLR